MNALLRWMRLTLGRQKLRGAEFRAVLMAKMAAERCGSDPGRQPLALRRLANSPTGPLDLHDVLDAWQVSMDREHQARALLLSEQALLATALERGSSACSCPNLP